MNSLNKTQTAFSFFYCIFYFRGIISQEFIHIFGPNETPSNHTMKCATLEAEVDKLIRMRKIDIAAKGLTNKINFVVCGE